MSRHCQHPILHMDCCNVTVPRRARASTRYFERLLCAVAKCAMSCQDMGHVLPTPRCNVQYCVMGPRLSGRHGGYRAPVLYYKRISSVWSCIAFAFWPPRLPSNSGIGLRDMLCINIPCIACVCLAAMAAIQLRPRDILFCNVPCIACAFWPLWRPSNTSGTVT